VVDKATGKELGSLSKVLTPQQLQAVESVRDDLARTARFKDLATQGMSAAPAPSVDQRLPGMLERGVYIANAVIKRLEGQINKKLAAEIAADMLNPPEFAKTLEQARQRQLRVKSLADAIERSRNVTIGVAAQQQ